jgi:hypothetical protein
MKKFAFVPMVALAFAACADADLPTAVAPDAASLRAAPAEVQVTGTFAQGGSGSAYSYIGDNKNVYCDAIGQAWNEQSESRVPGQDQYCELAGGSTQYRIVWTAQYVQATTKNLNFDNDPKGQIQHHKIHGVRGFNTTPVGMVYEVGSGAQVGTATMGLTQFTGAGWNETGGSVCLQTSSAAQASVTFGSAAPIDVSLTSFCW